jgi:transposase-like protein
MAKKGDTEEEILRVPREAESGATVVEICRKHGISQHRVHQRQVFVGLATCESN